MSSRRSNVNNTYLPASPAAGGNSAALPQNDLFLSTSGGTIANPYIAALSGKAIRGLVVGSVIEHWADGTLWDVSNNRALVPGQDFDAALLNAGGF